MGYTVFYAGFKRKKKQLCTKDSNQSRFVTKIRWVVVDVHRVIDQNYKLLLNQIHHSFFSEANSCCQISYVLVNILEKRLNSNKVLLE